MALLTNQLALRSYLNKMGRYWNTDGEHGKELEHLATHAEGSLIVLLYAFLENRQERAYLNYKSSGSEPSGSRKRSRLRSPRGCRG